MHLSYIMLQYSIQIIYVKNLYKKFEPIKL